MKIVAFSKERYNGGVRVKRRFGSSTVTIFWVHPEGAPAKDWEEIAGYGPTPRDRKTYAINKYLEMHSGAKEEAK